MDFNNNLNAICDFCNEQIQCAPFESLEGQTFCHLVCAKLYHDNVEPLKVNMKNYRKLYLNNQLSKLAMNIYDKLHGTLFNMMPISTGIDITDEISARDSYVTTLLRIK